MLVVKSEAWVTNLAWSEARDSKPTSRRNSQIILSLTVTEMFTNPELHACLAAQVGSRGDGLVAQRPPPHPHPLSLCPWGPRRAPSRAVLALYVGSEALYVGLGHEGQ